MNDKNTPETVKNRIQNEKDLLIEQLKKTPIIQAACEKTSVGRATFYRWKKEDAKFAQKADEALAEGVYLVNDMTESLLLTAIRDQNLTAILYWLNHRHPAYATRIEVTNKVPAETISPEQEKIIDKALKAAQLIIQTKGNVHEKQTSVNQPVSIEAR